MDPKWTCEKCNHTCSVPEGPVANVESARLRLKEQCRIVRNHEASVYYTAGVRL